MATKCTSRRTSAVVTSYLDLGAELDDTVRRDAEKLGRPRRNAYQSGIEALAPPRHPGTRTRFDVSATDEERELIRIEGSNLSPSSGESANHRSLGRAKPYKIS